MQYLQLQPGLVSPYIVEMGVAHRIAPYTTESHCGFFCLSHSGILPKSQGHGGFFLVRSGDHSQILGSHKL